MATKLKNLPAILGRNYEAKVNTFVRGKPGIGKTETIQTFVAQMRKTAPTFQLWQFYAPTMSPMDIQASAPDYEKNVLRMYNNAALPNAYTDPEAAGVIFFGELPNADPATSRLLQKYVNGEDMSGVLRKPEGVVVIADGNRIEDKSGVQQQGRAFMSRFEHIEAYTDATDNTEFASRNTWHPTVQAFFKSNPQLIDNYDEVFMANIDADRKNATNRGQMSEEGKIGIWANMRAWGRISKKEYVVDRCGGEVSLAEVAGNVGAGVAAQYEAHKKILSGLASFEEIMIAPEKVKIPTAPDEAYALALLVALRCGVEQLDKVYTFAQRLSAEMQVVILSNLAARRGFKLTDSAVYLNWITDPKLNTLLTGR